MKRMLLAGLGCLALGLAHLDVSAEEIVPAPDAAPAAEVPIAAKPSEGPQEADLSADVEKSKTKAKAEKDSDKGEAAASEETFATTLSATSDGSASSGPPDKAFSAKVSAPHNGSFTYSIDIREPDFRGLEPDIKLDYDSSQGIASNAAHQNWLGLGWSLGGFSVIERASPGRGTPFYDETLDTYLLDGAEMTACSTSMASPGCLAGGTHAMRIENYQRIVRDAAANSFTVTARDGTRYLYLPVTNWQSYDSSSTTETKLATNYRWLLASITDTHNNQVSYSYWCDGVQHCYPDEVSYNGTAIRFYREARPAEDQFDYATGVNLARVNHRIKTIEVKTGGVLVRA